MAFTVASDNSDPPAAQDELASLYAMSVELAGLHELPQVVDTALGFCVVTSHRAPDDVSLAIQDDGNGIPRLMLASYRESTTPRRFCPKLGETVWSAGWSTGIVARAPSGPPCATEVEPVYGSAWGE